MEDAGGTLEQAVERAGTDGVANAARLAELTGEEAALPKRQRGPRQSTVAPFSVRECSHVYLATARPFLGTWGGAGRRLARQRGARDAGSGLVAAGVSGGPLAATVSRARGEEV